MVTDQEPSTETESEGMENPDKENYRPLTDQVSRETVIDKTEDLMSSMDPNSSKENGNILSGSKMKNKIPIQPRKIVFPIKTAEDCLNFNENSFSVKGKLMIYTSSTYSKIY
jgi:hypothetical protein